MQAPLQVAAPPAHPAVSGSAIGGVLASAALAGGIGVLAYRLFLAEQRLDALETDIRARPTLPASTFRPVAAPLPQVPEPQAAPPPTPADPPPEAAQGVDAAAKVTARAPDSDDEEGPPST